MIMNVAERRQTYKAQGAVAKRNPAYQPPNIRSRSPKVSNNEAIRPLQGHYSIKLSTWGYARFPRSPQAL
jgi:hypothetical protein